MIKYQRKNKALKKTFECSAHLSTAGRKPWARMHSEGSSVRRTVVPSVTQRREHPSYSRPTSPPQSASFSLLQHLLQSQCPPFPACRHQDLSTRQSLLCRLNKFNFLVKTQLVLHSSGFNILKSTMSERECTVTHAFFLSINLRWPLLVTYGRVSLQEEVCRSYVHTVWSLQRLISVPGANLAVDTKGQLYAVFNSP